MVKKSRCSCFKFRCVIWYHDDDDDNNIDEDEGDDDNMAGSGKRMLTNNTNHYALNVECMYVMAHIYICLSIVFGSVCRSASSEVAIYIWGFGIIQKSYKLHFADQFRPIGKVILLIHKERQLFRTWR